MFKILDKTKCCGCAACANICAHGAIKMLPDELGFLYPMVDESLCVNCGLCEKVCGFHADSDLGLYQSSTEAYGVRHHDMSEIESSRSGAVFSALCQWTLAQNGVIYGVGYMDHFKVVHKRAETWETCYEFKGSKYVQSELADTFKEVKEDLKNGRLVLFSGTPCQISSLRTFLSVSRVDTSHLYLVDIVCHGVPSPYIWRDHLSNVEKKYGEKAVAVSFRDKQLFGWAAHKESFTFKDRTVYSTTFTHLFYEHIMFRDSCAVCPFANLKRVSDITLADFWGWENVLPNFNADDKGASLVLVNTSKGKELFNSISFCVFAEPVDLSKCMQPNLQRPSSMHVSSQQFREDYAQKGFNYIIKRYGDQGWRYKIKVLFRKMRTLKRILLIKLGCKS